jgi:hypothetical protein
MASSDLVRSGVAAAASSLPVRACGRRSNYSKIGARTLAPSRPMSEFPQDIYTEPSDIDVHTLRNLGPLAGLAGVWKGSRGRDVKPEVEGPAKQAYIERFELQPLDPVTNGPQLLYGLRYH